MTHFIYKSCSIFFFFLRREDGNPEGRDDDRNVTGIGTERQVDGRTTWVRSGVGNLHTPNTRPESLDWVLLMSETSF